jgi:hypothetical protein
MAAGRSAQAIMRETGIGRRFVTNWDPSERFAGTLRMDPRVGIASSTESVCSGDGARAVKSAACSGHPPRNLLEEEFLKLVKKSAGYFTALLKTKGGINEGWRTEP